MNNKGNDDNNNRMMRPTLKEGKKKLRPLSLSKIPRLSEGLPPFRIDGPSSSDSRSYPYCRNDSVSTAVSNSSPSYGSVLCSSSVSTSTNGGDTFSQLQDNPNNRKYQSDPNLIWMNPPRTNWNVSDSNLKSIPSYNPPMIPSNCTYISDVSPSIVATRIAHCLMIQSLITEGVWNGYRIVWDVSLLGQ